MTYHRERAPRVPDLLAIPLPKQDIFVLPFDREQRLQRANRVRKISLTALNQLVTTEGTYASSDKGLENGIYHGFFGRDDNISRFGIIEAYMWGADVGSLLATSIQGFKSLARYQGRRDNPVTGEERGKAAHEIRRDGYEHLARDNWYVDPNDHILKSWDTVDATSGRVVTWGRLLEYRNPIGGSLTSIDGEHLQYVRENLEWILRNMQQNDGIPAYTYNPDRPYNGLENQGWKDSWGAYKRPDGSLPQYPISPVEVCASTWSALRYGEKIFRATDSGFADLLRAQADRLKAFFNSPEGFMRTDPHTGHVYFAEALEGVGANRRQLEGTTSDVGLSLAYYFRDVEGQEESIIAREYMDDVVSRLMLPDLFDLNGGFRIYSNREPFASYDTEAYHRGPKTIWPWQSGMIAMGLAAFGYDYESDLVCAAVNSRIAMAGSAVELYMDDDYKRWANGNGQKSTEDQAFTAGFTLYTATRESVRLNQLNKE